VRPIFSEVAWTLNTVRDWLGHVSVDTTKIYAAVDLETKAKAIAHCEPQGKCL
jgi:hypothetical protein